ncbi:beta-propeller domain-containing protein [archaeon]|nr:beta-propeller domain-containing protein [Nanoarchaeota archaeon]MCG2724587.1 beta-propeller domain-containing protein [archaeon]
MSKNCNAGFCGKKAFGSALAGLGIVFLIIVAYSAIHYSSLDQPQASPGLKKIASLEELQKYLAENSDTSGYGYGGLIARSAMVTEQMAVTGASKSASDNSAPEVGGAPDYSQTNIQVAGVDEADIVKNDGKYIYTVSGNSIIIVEASPAENAKVLSKIDFNGSVNEIFLNGDRLVIFGQVYENYAEPMPREKEIAGSSKLADVSIARMPPIMYSSKTTIKIYDVADRNNPSILSGVSLEGNYYDSRMIGNYVYVIANQPTYYLYDAKNNVTVPRIYANGKAVSTAFPDMYYFEYIPGNVFTTIASIDLDNPTDVESKILLTNYAQNMYVSEKNIYITYTKWMSEFDYIDRLVEIITPQVPSDVREKINAAMALEISKQTKMQAVTEILGKYTASLSFEERQAFEENTAVKMEELVNQIAKEREKTIIQKIAIDNGNIEYKTSGEVPGNTLNQFSMDEHNGYFRIATTTSGNGGFVPMGGGIVRAQTAIAEATASGATGNAVSSTSQNIGSEGISESSEGITWEEQQRIEQENPTKTIAEKRVAPPPQPTGPLNHVYVLDEDLNIVGKLQDIASGERIYSVRFLGDKAYMVTFRQIDPLFVIDLSVPQDPKVLGYLKIPGVSDYLHPYDETHIIGVGRDATEEGRITGMKLSLFDVSDVANPKEISKYVIGERGTDSEALRDHKAFLFSKEKNLLVIPVSEYHQVNVENTKPEFGDFWRSTYEQSAYVFNIDLANGISLKGKISHNKAPSTFNETMYNYNYDYNTQIRRSLYIDNALYTISQKLIKMNALDTLDEINKVELPFEEQNYYGGVVY